MCSQGLIYWLVSRIQALSLPYMAPAIRRKGVTIGLAYIRPVTRHDSQGSTYVGGFATILNVCYLNGLRVRGNPTAITLPHFNQDTALLYPVSLSAMSTVGHSIGIPIDSYVPRPNNPLTHPGGGYK